MSLSIGIVGLPNVGKSSLFTALTKKGGLAANYPFATIDPNVGIVAVPDARLDALAAIDHPAKIVPATVEFVDIAGLVAGASQGEGLGNKFLANIREMIGLESAGFSSVSKSMWAVPGRETSHRLAAPSPTRGQGTPHGMRFDYQPE